MFFKKRKRRASAEETRQVAEQETTERLQSIQSFKQAMDLESAQHDAYLTLLKDSDADVFAVAKTGDGKQETATPVRSLSIKSSVVPPTAVTNYQALTDYTKVMIRHQPLKNAYYNIVVYNNDTVDLGAIVSFAAYDDAVKIVAMYGAGCVLRGEVDHISKEGIKPKAYYDKAAIADGFSPFTDEEYEKICATYKNGEYKEVRLRIIE